MAIWINHVIFSGWRSWISTNVSMVQLTSGSTAEVTASTPEVASVWCGVTGRPPSSETAGGWRKQRRSGAPSYLKRSNIFSIFSFMWPLHGGNKHRLVHKVLSVCVLMCYCVMLLISSLISRLSQRGSTDKLEKTWIMSSQRSSKKMLTKLRCTCFPSSLWFSTAYIGHIIPFSFIWHIKKDTEIPYWPCTKPHVS